MAPITPASAPLAGGSKNAIARCGAIRCPRMRCASVACWLGVATFSMGTEPIWQGSYSKQERAGILTAWSFPTPHYQLSNNHAQSLYLVEGATHTCTVLSQLPEAMYRPLEDQATAATVLLCPL